MSLESELDYLLMDYDAERFQQVFNNLISNAIKFTAAGGSCKVFIRTTENQNALNNSTPNIQATFGRNLIIKVKDSGVGIPADQLVHIFDRFYQVEGSTTRKGEGTGIGLALTKELVELMNGQISVESKEGQGSSFTVKLPIHRKAKKITPLSFEVKPTWSSESFAQNELLEEKIRPVILLVEDNYDVRNYLRECLGNLYQIEEAENGKIGIEKAKTLIPDLIISDVMMPEIDGFELCQMLKENELTSHIPIIMLTAKADDASKLEGLEYGADAYLSKPFNKQELLIRIKNLIAIRKQLQVRYQNISSPLITTNQQLIKEDAFVLKVKSIIEDRLNDFDFGPTQLAEAIFLSKTQLHRKLRALTNKSTGQYIHFIRLHKAKQLLEQGEMNVTQVALEVGYKELSYFSKLFSSEFGVIPSSIIK